MKICKICDKQTFPFYLGYNNRNKAYETVATIGPNGEIHNKEEFGYQHTKIRV